MGAFCVFGVSRSVCRKQAEKKVSTVRVIDGKRINLSAPEWGELVAVETERLFAESEKQVRISPELDAPQFCRDWLAAGPGEVRLARIMVRGPKLGKDDKPVIRKGAPVMAWLPYEGRECVLESPRGDAPAAVAAESELA